MRRDIAVEVVGLVRILEESVAWLKDVEHMPDHAEGSSGTEWKIDHVEGDLLRCEFLATGLFASQANDDGICSLRLSMASAKGLVNQMAQQLGRLAAWVDDGDG